MLELSDLYSIAEAKTIKVDCFSLGMFQSLSIQDSAGRCYIGIDPMQLESVAEEKVKLAHELGHCITGSFYNKNSPLNIRAKHEHRANRWAVQKIVPKNKLDELLKKGLERWELAEQFNVTESFIELAILMYYEYGIEA